MQMSLICTEKWFVECLELRNNDNLYYNVMNNKDFITKLSEKSGYSLDDTQKMVTSVIGAMATNFEEGEPVQISGFGTFEVKKRLERVMINPATGQKMLVPPKLVLNFRPSTLVKDKVKSGGEA